jgi:cell division protein FtsQ
MRRARRRRLRAAMPWAIAAAVLALAGTAAWIVFGTAVFGVREVRVNGAEILLPEQIRAAAAVPDGVALARVDTGAVADRVAALAPVAQVTVSRHWPETLVIDVVERTAAAVVPQDGQFAVVDSSGFVFRRLAQRPAYLPLVRVARPNPDDLTTRGALAVIGALTDELRDQLVEVVADGPARIKLHLRGKRTVIWGDATENDTKAKVATALLKSAVKTIDVSAPDVVTIR